MFALFAGERLNLIEGHAAADSFLVGDFGMHIFERNVANGEPRFSLTLETHPLPERIEPGEPAPESGYIDITDADPREILALGACRAWAILVRPAQGCHGEHWQCSHRRASAPDRGDASCS